MNSILCLVPQQVTILPLSLLLFLAIELLPRDVLRAERAEWEGGSNSLLPYRRPISVDGLREL